MEIRRIDVLISNNLLLFNVDNYAKMRESYPSLAIKFIFMNTKAYLEDILNYAVSSEEMIAVLKSVGSYRKQAEYVAMHPVFEGKVSSVLADCICELIHGRYLNIEDIEEGLLIQSIKYSSKDEIRLFVARKALFGLTYTPERCGDILTSMGGEYERICEPGLYSWLSWNSNNNRVAKYLFDNAFIKEYKRYENKIRILK